MCNQQKLPKVVRRAASRHGFDSVEEFLGAASKHVKGRYDDGWVKSTLRRLNDSGSVAELNNYILHLDTRVSGQHNCLAVR